MKRDYNFEIDDWLYIQDGNVEMLFKFLEFDGVRWTTDKCYQVVDNNVYISKGKFVITTNQEVVLADDDKIEEILDKAKNQE